MATNVTFTTLSADISNYLERGGSSLTDPTVAAQIPRLINAAERRCLQSLKLQGEIEVLASAPPLGGFLASNPVVAKPDRWRQTVSINYGVGAGNNTRTPLFPRSYEYCRSYWPDGTQTAPPVFYADYNLLNWLIVPTPDLAYPFEALLYMQPPLLDDSNQSNFFSTYTPNLLVKTALLETAIFLKDDARVQLFLSEMNWELNTLLPQDLQKELDRSVQRDKP